MQAIQKPVSLSQTEPGQAKENQSYLVHVIPSHVKPVETYVPGSQCQYCKGQWLNNGETGLRKEGGEAEIGTRIGVRRQDGKKSSH